MKLIFNKLLHSKISLFLAILLFLTNSIFAISLGDIQEKLSSSFGLLEDPNAGVAGYRALQIPFGGRSEAMGNAFTALSDDVSFFDYNAAASSSLKNTELAAFHNAWIADSAVETIAYTTRNQHTGIGFFGKFFYLPFTEYNIFGEDVSSGYYSESILGFNLSHNFFAGYKFKGISLGLNTKLAYRSVPNYTDNETNLIIPHSGLNQSGIAFVTDIGIKSSFNFGKFFISRFPNFNIGIALNNFGIGFTGLAGNFTKDSYLPTRLNAGFSWNMIEPLIVAFDFSTGINFFDFASSEQWATSLGFCYMFSEEFSLQGGFMLKGANPRFSFGSSFAMDVFLMSLTYTLDVSSSINPLNRISLSGKVNFGDKNRQEKQNTIDRLYSEGLTLYSEGLAEAAIDKWKEILLLDKNFDPAKDAIKTTEANLQLQKRIVEIQTLD